MGREQRVNGNSGSSRQQPAQPQVQPRTGMFAPQTSPDDEWHTEILRIDAAHPIARKIAIDDMKNRGWRHYLVVPSFGTMQEHYFDRRE